MGSISIAVGYQALEMKSILELFDAFSQMQAGIQKEDSEVDRTAAFFHLLVFTEVKLDICNQNHYHPLLV